MATKNKPKSSKQEVTDFSEKHLKNKKAQHHESNEEQHEEVIGKKNKHSRSLTEDETENSSPKRKREQENNLEDKKSKKRKNEIGIAMEKENEELMLKAKNTLKEVKDLKANEQENDQEPSDQKYEKLKKKYEYLKEMRVTEIEKQLNTQIEETVKREKAMTTTIQALKSENFRLVELVKDLGNSSKVSQLQTENEKLQLEIKSLKEHLKTAESKEPTTIAKKDNSSSSDDKINELKNMINFYFFFTGVKVVPLDAENTFECTLKNKQTNGNVVLICKLLSNNSVECVPKTIELSTDSIPEYLAYTCEVDRKQMPVFLAKVINELYNSLRSDY